MSIRGKFVEQFGEDQARAIEDAAAEHKNGIHDRKGSDPFRWALVICIGYQCMEKDGYRTAHGITAPWEDVKDWIKREAHLENHDGDCDYLAAFAGAYDEYMPQPAAEGD